MERKMLDQFIVMYLPRLEAFALRLSREPDDAADLVQDALLAAYKVHERIDPVPGRFFSYVCTAIRHFWVERLRVHRRRERLLVKCTLPDSVLMDLDARIDAPALLGKLSAEERVLLLGLADDEPLRDLVNEVGGTKYHTMAQRRSRLLQRLRNEGQNAAS